MNLAPNGKPSNLTPEQYKLVRTPAFKEWFGDWENSPETASKVVDENGEPKVVFHGSERSDSILISGIFKAYGSELNELYFTDNTNTALSYTYDEFFDDEEEWIDTEENIDNVIAVFLNIKNPKIKDFKGRTFTDFWNIKKDNDGNILTNVYDVRAINENLKRKDSLGNTYIVYKSEQIKLADGTNTTFDSNNPDIRYAEGGHLELDIKNVLKYLNPTSEEKEISIRQQWDDLINRFSSLIPYFFEQENIDYNCEDYECIDFLYENNLDSNFEKWIIDNFDNFNFEDFDIPSWYYFEKPKLIKGTFIHYSNNVDEILKNGFTKGVNDISILGMTTHLGDEYKKGSGFIFAYHIDDVKNIKLNRYGENCVLFEGIGVRAYHKIDKEYEVIINPKDIVNIRPCIRYKNGGLTMKKPKSKLLAPNGKPSNLTPEQYRIVRTPEFKEWFGDWENSPETSRYAEGGEINQTEELIKSFLKKQELIDDEPKRSYNDMRIGDTINVTNEYVDLPESQATPDKGIYKLMVIPISKTDHFIRGAVNREAFAYDDYDGWQTENLNNIKKTFDSDRRQPIIVSEGKDGLFTVIDGHHRLTVANELGRKSILALVREFKNNPIPSHYAESVYGTENVYGISKRYYKIKLELPNIPNPDIKNINFVNKIDEILNSENKYELGGELTLTSEQVEQKLGRKLHWWNDDVVTINGTEYKKVFLKPEYKRL